jgi:hypothetical protein
VRRAAVLLGLACLLGLLAPTAASAHQNGKAEPRIAAGISGTGLERVITVELTDLDSREPIAGATVEVSAGMTSPHAMRTAPWTLPDLGDGSYQARVRFPMAASWTLSIRVTGDDVVEASSELQAPVEAADGTATGTPSDVVLLPTTLDDPVTGRDAATIAVLWVHGIAAFGWIIGVVVMAIALGTRPGFLAAGPRQRLAAAYRDWGAWLHWGFVPVIVVTGVYNTLYVTPFPIAWTPSELEELANVPYGPLYEAILVVKLGLFAALLVTGTQVLLRTTREPLPIASGPGFVRTLTTALGSPGLLYLAIVPLIAGLAASLRYVHILSHVAEVVSAP